MHQGIGRNLRKALTIGVAAAGALSVLAPAAHARTNEDRWGSTGCANAWSVDDGGRKPHSGARAGWSAYDSGESAQGVWSYSAWCRSAPPDQFIASIMPMFRSTFE